MKLSEEGKILSVILCMLIVIFLAIIKISGLLELTWGIVIIPVLLTLLLLIYATVVNILKEVIQD